MNAHRNCRKCTDCALHGTWACPRHTSWYDNMSVGFFDERPVLARARPEISARVSARIDRLHDELSKLLNVFRKRADPIEHATIKSALLVAKAQLVKARILHVVPLIPARGRL